MKFRPAPTTENYPIERYLSETGQWEIGLAPVIYGIRVRAGRTEDHWSCYLDYCAGNDPSFQQELLRAVITILESFPEESRAGQLRGVFPGYKTKPIHLDPCWTELQRLAGLVKDSRISPLNRQHAQRS